MTPKKFNAAYGGLTPTAKKVYEHVPGQVQMTAMQIRAAMIRVNHLAPDKRVIEGVLSSLKDSGLVKEPERGWFQRVEVREYTITLPCVQVQERTFALQAESAAIDAAVKTIVENRIEQKMTAAAKTAAAKTEAAKTEAAKIASTSTIELFSNIAAAMRGDADRARDNAYALAKQIEDGALLVEDQSAANAADGDKLRQLQATLRTLMGNA